MRLNALVAAVALFVLAAMPSAQARPYERSGWDNWSQGSASGARPYRTKASRSSYRGQRSARTSRYGTRTARYASRTSSRGAGGRPSRWCGWWMRTQKGGGAHLNLAWNWSRWGSASSPQVGAVVVWRHHVGMITGRASNGQWIVKSGNDGGRVRERARSVSGAVFRVG